MHILRGVDISVMDHAAFGAGPLPHIEFEGRENISTMETAFGGGIPFVDFDEVSPII